MGEKAIGILLAIVSLAGLAVVVSRKSNTANVLTALLGGFTGAVKAAVSPVA